MSYHFHITRADFWPDSELSPIAQEEWETVANVHPGLLQDGYLEWSDAGRQAAYTIADETIWFSWKHGRVDISGVFTEKAMKVAGDLASQLKASIVGDDD
ncbi:hypothetical protein ACWEQL_41180 [Kitasatospora sp. NPDC004240]